MKKSELKTGMWVEVEWILRGVKTIMMAIVLLGTENGDILSGQTWCHLDFYNENLEYEVGYPTDIYTVKITKVYQTSANKLYLNKENVFDFSQRQDEIIWVRPNTERKDNI